VTSSSPLPIPSSQSVINSNSPLNVVTNLENNNNSTQSSRSDISSNLKLNFTNSTDLDIDKDKDSDLNDDNSEDDNTQQEYKNIYDNNTNHAENWEIDHVKCINILVDKGAQIKSVDKDGMTALHWSGLKNSLATLEELLKHGAEVNARDNEGKSPLHCVAISGGSECAMTLLQKGAELDSTDLKGRTALYLAVIAGNSTFESFAVNNGANLDIKDINGISARTLIQRRSTVREAPPESPKLISKTATSINLTWQTADNKKRQGEKGTFLYEIWMADKNSESDPNLFALVYIGTDLAHVFSNLTSTHTYEFKLLINKPSGSTPFSNILSVLIDNEEDDDFVPIKPFDEIDNTVNKVQVERRPTANFFVVAASAILLVATAVILYLRSSKLK